jgi:hypothetical protein
MSGTAPTRPEAGFLADPEVDDQVQRMYDSDRDLQGYVANLTRVWAYSPEALALLSYILKRATDAAGIDQGQRALLVTAAASTLGDSYCSLAWGRNLAASSGDDLAARVVAGPVRQNSAQPVKGNFCPVSTRSRSISVIRAGHPAKLPAGF